MMKKHTAEPIKNKKEITAIEQYLRKHNERDYVLWVLGVNSGLRVSDIIALNVADVVDKTHITIIEKKTQKRKSFGYHHYQQYKDTVILQKIFNHSSNRITLMYIGIEQDEIDTSYKNFEL